MAEAPRPAGLHKRRAGVTTVLAVRVVGEGVISASVQSRGLEIRVRDRYRQKSFIRSPYISPCLTFLWPELMDKLPPGGARAGPR
jgi:hypothetical protein